MTATNGVRLIFAGGGTGGHLFPAIAIANRVTELLKSRMKVEIVFVGTQRGIEYRMRDSLGYPLHIINVRGIARSLTLKNLMVPFILVGALIKASGLIRKFRPHMVVGTGGYVCWPVLRMASWRKIPTVLQEQNSFPGVTIRQLAGRAKKIFLGFESARQYLKTEAEIVVSGNPVRSSIAAGNRAEGLAKYGLNPAKKTILVLGGSQGARAINNAVLSSLEKTKLDDRFQILWQTGERDYKEVADRAGNKVFDCALFPFAQQMDLVYAAADLVIARAGALSLAEITACGLPAILIPYPFAAGDHQRKNAEDYTRRGMAVVVDEKELAQRDIVAEAVELMTTNRYQTMKQAVETETAGRRPAVDIIAEDIVAQLTSLKDAEDKLEHRPHG